MSLIKLNKLQIENFKGIKSFEFNVDGSNVSVEAENGIGKTTIYDAFLFLFFGKDSTGRKDFELRPLDSENQPIKGLTLVVRATLDIDGTIHVLHKEHHEKVVKGQLRGYETLCWIDEVPKKVGEFNDYIAELIPEDTFKLLTDLHFFNAKMHWTDRRTVLLDIAGEIGSPEGFNELLSSLNGRDINEYKKVLVEQKKRLVKEQSEINPRIDEIQRNLDNYVETDTESLNKKRTAVKNKIQSLKEERAIIAAKEKERQHNIDLLNSLKGKKVHREAALKSDMSGIQNLLNERSEISAAIAKKEQTVASIEGRLGISNLGIKTTQNKIDRLLSTRNTIYVEYSTLSEEPTKGTCYACGQTLPKEQLDKNKEHRKQQLSEITERGDKAKKAIEEKRKILDELDKENKEVQAELDKAKVELSEAKEQKESRFAEINAAIEAHETPPPKKDEEWQKICVEIANVEKQIGSPVTEQVEKIDNELSEKNTELEEINNALAQSDNMKQAKARIEELNNKEKQLAQQIADAEKQLADIEQYKAEQNQLITSSVNNKFQHVEFKMFKELINGGCEECCESTLNGIPFADMSSGQQILVGLDIVNVLSEHYGLSVPLFIDHAESMTLPIETRGQVVKLIAQKGYKKLIVSKN